MPFSNLPQGATDKALIGAFLTLLAVWWGRLMYHAEEVRAGRRRFWSWDLLLDLPVVAGMFFVSWGAVEWFQLGPGMGAGVGAVLGWLGPRGLRAAVETWIRVRQGPAPKA